MLHVISGLYAGGAEKILARLVSSLRGSEIESQVVCLLESESVVTEEIRDSGVPLRFIGSKPSIAGVPGFLRNLRRAIVEASPDVIQGWLYHGNLATLVGRRVSGRPIPICWSVHHTLGNLGAERPELRRLVYLGRLFSRQAAAIHYVSHTSAAQHEAYGYSAAKRIIIPNCCDTQVFRKDPDARRSVLSELALEEGSELIGHIARPHPMKDHRNLLEAARLAVREHARRHLHWILVGPGIDATNFELTGWIEELGLVGHVHLLGERNDIPRLMSAFDLGTVSSAWGEASPTVILEALACETPCVVTDIGDSATLLGDAGIVVPPQDAQALCRGWLSLLDLPDTELARTGRAGRERVESNYSFDVMRHGFSSLYTRIVGSGC